MMVPVKLRLATICGKKESRGRAPGKARARQAGAPRSFFLSYSIFLNSCDETVGQKWAQRDD
eukprot:3367470-Pyramimonas_sp.AAC.1